MTDRARADITDPGDGRGSRRGPAATRDRRLDGDVTIDDDSNRRDRRFPWPEFPSPIGIGWDDVAVSDADSVELKVLLAIGPDAAAARLAGRRVPRWRVRQVHLLDTPTLHLARAGLEVRLRRRARGRHDLTVRVRHPWAGRPAGRPSGARVELDVLPGAAWRTTELRHELDPALAAEWLAGRARPRRLFAPDQADWIRRQLGVWRAGEIADALVDHGPLIVHRLRVPAGRFPVARARLEHCRYADGQDLVEFSARCAPREAPAVATAVCAVLARRGITVADRHRTKTAVWVEELAGAG